MEAKDNQEIQQDEPQPAIDNEFEDVTANDEETEVDEESEREADEDEFFEYDVDDILAYRITWTSKGPSQEYLVKWTGYVEPTWEPVDNAINCDRLIEEFQAKEAPGVSSLAGKALFIKQEYDSQPGSPVPSTSGIKQEVQESPASPEPLEQEFQAYKKRRFN